MWQNKMNRNVAACTGRFINACREFALAGVSEFPGCRNVDVKPLWWFSEREQKGLAHLSVAVLRLFQVSYTFDAGPNAVIFTLKQHVPEFLQLVQHFFPPETNGGQ